NLWCGSVLSASKPLAASTISRSYDSLPDSRMVVRYARMDEESSTTRTFMMNDERGTMNDERAALGLCSSFILHRSSFFRTALSPRIEPHSRTHSPPAKEKSPVPSILRAARDARRCRRTGYQWDG